MKAVTWLVIAIVVLGSVAVPSVRAAESAREPGGPAAFFIGCCLGLRVGLEYNEGAEVHWREWIRLVVPFIGIWDGIECNEGITAHEWAEKNGADWY